MDPYNPIYMMSDSGARGSISQIRQLVGMRGLIANTSGGTIEVPIRSNYREGLNVLEYFISSRGARKGLADTALRTADSGYLTRRLVDVSQDVIIREDDCGTHHGIEVYDIKDGEEMIEPLTERLVGRYLADDFCDPQTGEVVVSRDVMMGDKEADLLVNQYGVKRIAIRSVLTCESKRGVCAPLLRRQSGHHRPRHRGRSGGHHRRSVHRRAGHPADHAYLPHRRRRLGGGYYPGSSPCRGAVRRPQAQAAGHHQ